MQKKGKQIVLCGGVIAALAIVWAIQNHFAAVRYRALQAEFSAIQVMNGSSQVEERSNHKPNDAYIERRYSTNSVAEEITNFYGAQFGRQNWKYEGNRSLPKYADSGSVTEFVFSKGDYQARLDIPVDSSRSEYWISLTWGLP